MKKNITLHILRKELQLQSFKKLLSLIIKNIDSQYIHIESITFTSGLALFEDKVIAEDIYLDTHDKKEIKYFRAYMVKQVSAVIRNEAHNLKKSDYFCVEYKNLTEQEFRAAPQN